MFKNDSDSARGPSNRPFSPDDEGQGLLWHNLTDFYCNFFDLIGLVVIMIDSYGTVRLLNKKAEDLTGYSKEESVGQDWFSLMLPEQLRASARDRLLNGIQQGAEHISFSMPIVAKGGARRPVCWSMSMVRDDRGKVFGLIGLGYLPAGPDTPCVEISQMMGDFSTSVCAMTHDLLNHSQVALGYLELAMDRTGENKELQCMLDRAYRALKKCGEIGVNVHRLSNNPRLNHGEQ